MTEETKTAENQTKKSNEHVWKWATFVLAIVLVAVVAYWLGSRGNTTTGQVVDNGQQNVVAATAGNSPFLGPSNAKVTVIEFSDYQCPYCGAAAGTQATLIAQFKNQDPTWTASEPELVNLAKAGKIKLVFRNFPLTSIHQNAEKAAEASLCANDQGKFWQYHDLLFKNQDQLTVTNLKAFATELSLDTAKFNTCLDSGNKAAVVQQDIKDATAAGVSGTPTFFVNGQTVEGAQPFSAFKSALGL
jgi:protein-disulfide isomerase